MKWSNKGHQLDWLAEKHNFRYSSNLYLYGAGVVGQNLAELLIKYSLCSGFVDNDKSKQKMSICGLPVISYQDFKSIHGDKLLVITMSQENTVRVASDLEKQEETFVLHGDFIQRLMPVLLWYKYKKVFVPITQISLTERCTLKCKKCAHGCFNVSMDQSDMTFEGICDSADNFFRYVDFINEFVLIGGEPLLHKDLLDVVKYIGERYRDKINIFSITSNGTIMPSDKLLSACKIYNVIFRISNYSISLPKLKKQYEKLAEKMSFFGVEMTLGKADHNWMDYGFDHVKRNCDDNELVYVFDACHTPCHEVQDDKFYYCVMAHTVANNLHFDVGQDDYFLLEKASGEQLEANKLLFLEYTLGYSEKGYLDMCRYCNGADAKKHLIPVAEQINKETGHVDV